MNSCLPIKIDRALRWAARAHKDQVRKGDGVPYVQHVVAVAWALERLGFDEEVVVAGLLHDVVEDTEATLDDVLNRFGPHVASLVSHCSEVKLDETGRKRPWIDRKRDQLAAVVDAPVEAKGIFLADKLHNLLSIRADLDDGLEVWNAFNAPRDRVLWYHEAAVEACAGTGDARLERLSDECRTVLASLAADAPESEDPKKIGEVEGAG